MKKLAKILPLVAIGFAVILGFSGCDKILELMYPEETGTGEGGGGYGVTLRVNISTSVDMWGSQIIVRLESASGATQDRRGYAYSADGVTASFAAGFDYIAEDDYRVFAWLDSNPNIAYDSATEASGGRDWFHLPYTDFSSGSTMDHATFDVDLTSTGDVNSVTLRVLIDKDTFGAEWNTANLAVELRSMDGWWFPDPIRHGTAVDLDPADPEYWTKGVFEVTYEYLPMGGYQLVAWVDAVNDSWYDPTTETGVTVGTDHGNVFPIPYYSPWDPSVNFAAELVAYLYGASYIDPSFSMAGPSSVDRVAPGSQTLYATPTVYTTSFSSIEFRIRDTGYNPIGYSGTTEYVGASFWGTGTDNQVTFDIDLGSWLDTPLSASYWDAYSYVIVQVRGTYTNGSSYEAEYWMYLASSAGGGSYYNLTLSTYLDEMAPYGYVDVYVNDAYGSNLAYWGGYLDNNGQAFPTLYSVFDAVGQNQTIYVYLYNQYWSYLAGYSYSLNGDLSGDLSLMLDDWGAWTQYW